MSFRYMFCGLRQTLNAGSLFVGAAVVHSGVSSHGERSCQRAGKGELGSNVGPFGDLVQGDDPREDES